MLDSAGFPQPPVSWNVAKPSLAKNLTQTNHTANCRAMRPNGPMVHAPPLKRAPCKGRRRFYPGYRTFSRTEDAYFRHSSRIRRRGRKKITLSVFLAATGPNTLRTHQWILRKAWKTMSKSKTLSTYCLISNFLSLFLLNCSRQPPIVSLSE